MHRFPYLLFTLAAVPLAHCSPPPPVPDRQQPPASRPQASASQLPSPTPHELPSAPVSQPARVAATTAPGTAPAAVAPVIVQVPATSASPQPPAPARRISIVDFSARADAVTAADIAHNTEAIQQAIDSLAQSGGTVVIPTGTFTSGALFLKPGVNLHLDKDAVLKGSANVADFPLTRTRIEGHFQEWVPALINATACDHLVIDGEGTLDGNGQGYWNAFRSAVLIDRSTKNLDVPRPRLIFIRESSQVRVAGIHLLNSGFWNLHLYKSQHVDIDGLDIRAGAGSPSTDGIDIDSSQFINISNTFISNNDDCIALKGTKGVNALDDKDSPPVEHVHVWNCTFAMGNGLITCGSEATIVRDVKVDHCNISGPDTRGIAMLRMKLRTDTPQDYEDIHFSDITLDGAGTVLAIAPWSQYEDLKGQPAPTHTVKNISLTSIKGTFGTLASVRGNAGDAIADITFANISLKLATPPTANALSAIKDCTVKNVTLNGSDFKP